MASPATSTPTYHHALSLDMHTLSLLLKRNYDQHRRCIYFRRLTMMMSALRRLPSFEEMNGWMEQWKDLARLLLDECEGSKGVEEPNSHARKRRVKEEQWTLEKDGDHAAFKIISQYDNDNLQQLQEMPIILQRLKTLTTQSIPEITSRIIHATSPMLCEISRGYFVPFLTVALACIGRIRTLLLKMGRELAIVLQEMVPQLRDLCEKNKRVICNKDIMDWKILEDLVMPAFVVVVKKNGKQQAITKTKIAVSQEWNDLMTHFLEVSQDDLTKQTNEFVKEKRWGDAMSRFGLGSSDYSNNTSKLPVKQLEGHQGDGHDAECDGLSSNDENEAQPLVENDKTDDYAHNDMGELVDDMHPTCDLTTPNKFSSGDAVDENMARIMQKRKEKRNATTSPTPESSVAKKKRRRRKGGKQIIADGASNENTNRAKPAEVEMDTGETTYEEEAHLKKRKQSIAASMGDENEASADMQPDSIRTEEYSDVAKEKKSKKKSSKKAKKQKRKSSNVMDDIFGS